VDLGERSTLRGLTTGIVKLRSDSDLLPCVVFGEELSSWLPVLGELGYRAILVLLRDEKHLAAVEDLVEDKCAVWCGPDWGVFGEAMPSFGNARSMMGFVEGRVTDELRQMAEGMGIQTLIGTKGARRSFPGWHASCQRVEHAAVGGVTSGVVTLTALTRRPCMLKASGLPYVVKRDASTVLSVQPFVSTFRAIPPPIGAEDLRCVNLGTAGHPYYHGAGLLPGLLTRRVRVLAPALFAPKGLWGLRHITSDEILVAKDFPPCTVAKISGETLSSAILGRLSPGKCLVFGFRALINGGG
jgi:hypothetical protein